MDLKLQGKVAVVTAASKGIGLAIVPGARRGRRARAIDYGAAKAALVNLAKSLSQELGPRGIRINSVSPGPVATDLWLGEKGVARVVGQRLGLDAEAARDKILAGIGGLATGRLTTPEEVAAVVVLLPSERTANVTGSDYVIDGGLLKTL